MFSIRAREVSEQRELTISILPNSQNSKLFPTRHFPLTFQAHSFLCPLLSPSVSLLFTQTTSIPISTPLSAFFAAHPRVSSISLIVLEAEGVQNKRETAFDSSSRPIRRRWLAMKRRRKEYAKHLRFLRLGKARYCLVSAADATNGSDGKAASVSTD